MGSLWSNRKRAAQSGNTEKTVGLAEIRCVRPSDISGLRAERTLRRHHAKP